MLGRLLIAFIAWFGMVCWGAFQMMRYEFTPGQIHILKEPSASRSARHSARGELKVFLHPQCPCSFATLDAIESALRGREREIDTTFYVFSPKGVSNDWAHTELWRRAKDFIGAKIVKDVDGQKAEESGAYTSGTVQCFDGSHRLVFEGGVTPGRGQEGSCLGYKSVLAFLHGAKGVTSTPVFGCAIVTGDLH